MQHVKRTLIVLVYSIFPIHLRIYNTRHKHLSLVTLVNFMTSAAMY